MTESGLVIDVLENNNIIVAMKRSSACSKCRICKSGRTENEMIVEVINACDARYGDFVNVELDEKVFLKSVLIMYAIPLAALLVGFFLGLFLSSLIGFNKYNELISFIVGIILMIISFFCINLNEKKINKKKLLPQATSITRIAKTTPPI